MRRWIPALAGAVAVIGCGVVHGLWTNRWGLCDEPQASALRLQHVPLSLPDWSGQVEAFPPQRGSKLAGQTWHRYTHRRTGEKVSVFIVCDRPGPVSIHTPDVCYGATGYDVSTPTRFSLPSSAGEATGQFWTAEFKKHRSTERHHLRIFWGWSGDGSWVAADEPRMAFTKYTALFKMYVIREVRSSSKSLEEDPSVDLMKQLLPRLNGALFPRS